MSIYLCRACVCVCVCAFAFGDTAKRASRANRGIDIEIALRRDLKAPEAAPCWMSFEAHTTAQSIEFAINCLCSNRKLIAIYIYICIDLNVLD